jgi:hypothetical protein
MKRKTRDIPSRKKSIYFTTYPPPKLIHLSHRFTRASKHTAQVFWLLSQPLPHVVGHHLLFSNVLERIFRTSCEQLFAPNRKQEYLFTNILCIQSLCSQKAHNRTLLFGSILKHGRHFCYWNQPMNTRMRVCYLDSYEVGLCCYLVIHIEILLRLSEPLYFHWWPIYWLPRNTIILFLDSIHRPVII